MTLDKESTAYHYDESFSTFLPAFKKFYDKGELSE